MRKLTLVSIYSNGKRYACFMRCIYKNNKATLTPKQLQYLQSKVGATERGITYTLG